MPLRVRSAGGGYISSRILRFWNSKSSSLIKPATSSRLDFLEFGDGIPGFLIFRRGFGHGLGAFSGEEGLEIEILSGWGRCFAAFGEHVGGVGEIEDGEVDPFVGGPGAGDLELAGDLGDRAHGVVFDGPDADLGVEDHDQEAVLIDVVDEEAVILALLINAGEIGFADQAGDALSGGVGGGSEGTEGGGVECPGITAFGDDESAFIENESRSGLAFPDEVFECDIEVLNILLEQLGQRGHIYALRALLSLMYLCSNMRVIMLRVSKTPSHWLATAGNEGT